MGALANAVVLRNDPVFKDWIETAIAYQARVIITTEAVTAPKHTIRLRLAKDAATSPQMILGLMITAVATDPSVASKGTTMGAQITEGDIISGVEAAWTVIAELTYPNG
jgi:hypothetical protein